MSRGVLCSRDSERETIMIPKLNCGVSFRFPASNNNQEEQHTNALDASFTQFIAENFPSYTCIFQLVLPRFMRLDLSAYKNAVMLFRLGKVCVFHLHKRFLKYLNIINILLQSYFCRCFHNSICVLFYGIWNKLLLIVVLD